MTIDEAITILQIIIETGDYLGEPDDRPALELGIEALKRIRTLRRKPDISVAAPLPSETQE